jgi:hypothetical protein
MTSSNELGECAIPERKKAKSYHLSTFLVAVMNFPQYHGTLCDRAHIVSHASHGLTITIYFAKCQMEY